MNLLVKHFLTKPNSTFLFSASTSDFARGMNNSWQMKRPKRVAVSRDVIMKAEIANEIKVFA